MIFRVPVYYLLPGSLIIYTSLFNNFVLLRVTLEFSITALN
jgi:hypothetical protein